jgi:hypothetical protein
VAAVLADGASTAGDWARIPKGRWVHLYVAATAPFSDDLLLFASSRLLGALAGRVAHVQLWSRALPFTLVGDLALAFDYAFQFHASGMLANFVRPASSCAASTHLQHTHTHSQRPSP